MNFQQPKTFFKKLKETCRKLDQDVNAVKNRVYDHPGNDELACKKVCEFQDQIKTLKKEANELKFDLEPKLAHTANFIKHFTELFAETETSIVRNENYLQQYGYKPLEKTHAAIPAPVENFTTPDKQSSKENGVATPNLIHYGIVSRGISGSTSISNDRKSSLEDLIPPKKVELDSLISKVEKSDSTPTLDITDLNLNTDKETPPVPSLHLSHIPDFPSTPTLEL